MSSTNIFQPTKLSELGVGDKFAIHDKTLGETNGAEVSVYQITASEPRIVEARKLTCKNPYQVNFQNPKRHVVIPVSLSVESRGKDVESRASEARKNTVTATAAETFTCPACGGHELTEVQSGVGARWKVSGVSGSGANLQFDYEPEPEVVADDNGEIEKYQCQKCRYTLRLNSGMTVTNFKEFTIWRMEMGNPPLAESGCVIAMKDGKYLELRRDVAERIVNGSSAQGRSGTEAEEADDRSLYHAQIEGIETLVMAQWLQGMDVSAEDYATALENALCAADKNCA